MVRRGGMGVKSLDQKPESRGLKRACASAINKAVSGHWRRFSGVRGLFGE